MNSAALIATPNPIAYLDQYFALLATYHDEPWRVIQIYHGYRFSVLLLTFLLGKFLAHLWNVSIKDSSELALLRAIEDEEFESLLFYALRKEVPILFTLRSGKIYLAWVVSIANPRKDRRWLRVLPLAAGFRDNQHRPHFVTDYAEVLSRVQAKDKDFEHLEIGDFEVVITTSEIDYAHMYDPTIAERFDFAATPRDEDLPNGGVI